MRDHSSVVYYKTADAEEEDNKTLLLATNRW